jgi:hypothetical protein
MNPPVPGPPPARLTTPQTVDIVPGEARPTMAFLFPGESIWEEEWWR